MGFKVRSCDCPLGGGFPGGGFPGGGSPGGGSPSGGGKVIGASSGLNIGLLSAPSLDLGNVGVDIL